MSLISISKRYAIFLRVDLRVFVDRVLRSLNKCRPSSIVSYVTFAEYFMDEMRCE